MNFSAALDRGILFFDGGYGTLLQKRGLSAGVAPEVWNLTHPEILRGIHSEYLASGADIIKTNTFGANLLRYPADGGFSLEEIVSGGVLCARRAADACGRAAFVALDIGPCGKLVGQDLGFEEAVGVFAATVRLGAPGCDLVLLETFGDLAELRAAILAVKENCRLPFVVTCAVGADGRTFTGTPVEVLARVCEGMGAAAVGLNCSNGPAQMLPLVPRLLASTRLPVCLNPNAGLPEFTDGKTEYRLGPDGFAAAMEEAVKAGIRLAGGCCGTAPAHIAALTSRLRGAVPARTGFRPACVCTSAQRTAVIGEGRVCVIGERINPTGKPKLKDALRRGDIEYLVSEAMAQKEAGADILDVNTGLPEIDEPAMLCAAVERLQKTVSLPLQIDTSDPAAMEAALRNYHGQALINSVNGSKKSLDGILPLAAKYGGTVIGLTLDENGIPDTPEGRYAIAERIVRRCAEFGIGPERIIIDPLALTLGADPHAAEKTLAALHRIREGLGVHTSLGVSNISFGLPDREKVNCAFLREAVSAGLDAAIMNPMCAPMMRVAAGEDCGDGSDLGSLLEKKEEAPAADTSTLGGAVFAGLSSRAAGLAEQLCGQKSPQNVISEDIIPALDRVGAGFADGSVFLPGLLAAADAAIAALGAVTAHMPAAEDSSRGTVVLATVEGDVHDIGKNIVGVMLRSYGFRVSDLGRNVPADAVAEEVLRSGARCVGLSALMTTTVPSMERTVALVHARCPGVSVCVGGAVLTAETAAKIGADAYCADASDTVRFAGTVYGGNA